MARSDIDLHQRVAEQEAYNSCHLGIYSPSSETIASRITNIVQIVIGLILLAGKRGNFRLIRSAVTIAVITSPLLETIESWIYPQAVRRHPYKHSDGRYWP